MNINRSALTANVVMGLPNVRSYVYKDRERLMEERRLRLAQVEAESDGSATASGSGQN